MIVEISKIVDFQSEILLNVIYDVEKYHEFINWCNISVVSEDVDQKSVDVSIIKSVFRYNFPCKVERTTNKIAFFGAKLMHFDINGFWNLEKIDENSTNVSFYINLNTSIKLVENLLKPRVSAFSIEIIELFESRCKQIVMS